jgi:hypothetical protein
VYNRFSIECELNHRRQEWQRGIAAEAKAALAQTERGPSRRMRLPSLTLVALRLKRLTAPRLSLAKPTGPGHCAIYESAPRDEIASPARPTTNGAKTWDRTSASLPSSLC